MLSCVIIDDEPMARSLLIDHCKLVPTIKVVGEFSNGLSAIEFLKTKEVNLIFLDIQMPDLSGLDLIKIIDNHSHIIITTAFPEYALDGFDLDVTDYLLKPFDFSRFLRAINKVSNSKRINISNLIERDYIFVKDGRDLVKIAYTDLIYIKGAGDYVTFWLKDKRIMTLMALKDLEVELPQDIFARIHQSYIINKNCIQRVSGNQVKIAGEFLPISRTYKKSFYFFLEKN